MRISKKREAKEYFKLLLFIGYNLCYIFQMQGFISRDVYLIVMGLFCIFCMGDYYTHKNKHLGLNVVKSMTFFIVSISVITILIQFINFNFNLSQWSFMIYWIIPIVGAYYWYNSTDKDEQIIYFYIFFVRFLLFFFLNFGENFNLSNILSISWDDSMSSAFESSDAHNFLFMTMIFLYFKKRILAYASAFFCLISFKRLAFILVIALVIGYRWIPNKKVPKVIVYISIAFFCICPFIIMWILSSEGHQFFMSRGINIDEFTSNRTLLIDEVTKSIPQFNGFGTMDAYMQIHPYGKYHPISIMHCDYYMLYKECSIISTIIMTVAVLKPSSKDWKCFLMAVYICFEMFISTFFTSIATWMLFYMFELIILCNTSLDPKKEVANISTSE